MDTTLQEMVVWLANRYGLRYTPLHHRAYAHVFRLSTMHREQLLRKIAEMLRYHKVGATDPLRKLDGAWYIEIF